jgi:hypothetical protein
MFCWMWPKCVNFDCAHDFWYISLHMLGTGLAQSVWRPGYALDGRGSFLGRGYSIFAIASRQALGPIQPPTQLDVTKIQFSCQLIVVTFGRIYGPGLCTGWPDFDSGAENFSPRHTFKPALPPPTHPAPSFLLATLSSFPKEVGT